MELAGPRSLHLEDFPLSVTSEAGRAAASTGTSPAVAGTVEACHQEIMELKRSMNKITVWGHVAGSMLVGAQHHVVLSAH
eukprot:1135900-Amphidinium_carterae.1